MKQILQKLLVVTFLLAITQQLDAHKIEVTDALSTAKNFIANTEYGKKAMPQTWNSYTPRALPILLSTTCST
jgi:hypothetical protein